MDGRDHLEAIAGTARALADAARAVTLPLFRSAGLAPDNKLAAGFDPVTEADRAAERAMRAILAQTRPEDAILGEEYGPQPGTSGLTWVLDPIDGTRAFISGIPSWGTLIGVTGPDGRAIHGLIDQPFLGERLEGGAGGARCNGAAIGVRRGVALGEATILTTFPEMGAFEAPFRRVAERCRLTRYGLDCYGYALLAMGHVDLVIEAGLQPYDIVASIAVIEAAGGIVTDWQGGRAEGGGCVIAAATRELHDAALGLLA